MPAAAALNSWTQHPWCDIPWKIITSHWISGEGCEWSSCEWNKSASPRPGWAPEEQLGAVTATAGNSCCSWDWQCWSCSAPQGSPWPTAAPALGVLLQLHFPVHETPWLFWKLNPPDTSTTPRLCHSLILRFSSVLSLRDPSAPQTAFSAEEQPSEQIDYKFIK